MKWKLILNKKNSAKETFSAIYEKQIIFLNLLKVQLY